jgi:hypothetical protein
VKRKERENLGFNSQSFRFIFSLVGIEEGEKKKKKKKSNETEEARKKEGKEKRNGWMGGRRI